MWINSLTSSENILYLKVQGSYQLVATLLEPVPVTGFGNWDGTLTATGQTLAALAALVEAFVEEAGYPWIIIGDITTGNGAVAAVNMKNVVAMNQSGSGVGFNGGDSTSGYAPYANYAAAHAALLELAGNYTF